MFTLCMSRGHPSLQDVEHQNNAKNRPVKEGFLLRYRRGLFCKQWCVEWFVLYEDSTLAWFADKSLNRLRGRIRISETPELLAVGEWTRQVPKKPSWFPLGCRIGQFLAIGTTVPHNVYWLMAQSPSEVNDWMTAISNTLPPPPFLASENKRLALTPDKNKKSSSQPNVKTINSFSSNNSFISHSPTFRTPNNSRNRNNDADYAAFAGVAIDWGHGWGWSQYAWTAQAMCCTETAVTSAINCHAPSDYTVSNCEDMDFSAFGDFIF